MIIVYPCILNFGISAGSTKLPSLKQAAKTPQQTEDEELEALRASMAI